MQPSRSISRRTCLLAGLAGMGLAHGADPKALPLAVSLQQELAMALRDHQPLVVMVSLEGCPFCKVVRENYLVPMREQEGLHVVQVDMRSQKVVRDFRGVGQTHDAMVRSWRIRLAPTVLFFGRNGQEVAGRLIGGYLPDFYGAYLNERLQLARSALN